MNLTEHFTVAEFTASDYAARNAVDNSLPATMLQEAQRTCELLERIRGHLTRMQGRVVPLILTSGYRCAAVNAAAGSAPTSDHLRGMAADFKAPSFGTPYQVAQALAPHVSELEIGQLIHEFGGWIHVSTRRPDRPVNRIITISRRGTEAGIVEA